MANICNEFKCCMCFFQDSVFELFCTHVVRCHRHDPNFVVNCGFGSRSFVEKSWVAYKMHVRRKHRAAESSTALPCDLLTAADVQNCVVDDFGSSSGDVGCKAPSQVLLSAAYLLSLETEHKLSQNGLNDVITATQDLLSQQILCCKQQIEQKYQELGIQPNAEIRDSVMSDGFFEGLKTTHQRHNFYRNYCHLVEPQTVYMGERMVKSKGRISCQKRFGEIVPFQSNLTALLELPDVWCCIQKSHASTDKFMRDACDGLYVKEHAIFSQKVQALQIMLYTDDIEVVNPIGAHVKKHKLTMFYFTLSNIPPEYRSRLKAIQLLAIAKTKDVREFGVKTLLQDFLQTVSQLATGGIVFQLHGQSRLIHGGLLMVCADTPAAHWLGGFKEGVGFAHKICRSCDASETSMRTNMLSSDFHARNLTEHRQRCESLALLSRDALKYWSKHWGINTYSLFCDVPHFDLCVALVQDPMHLLLEGVLPYELKLLLTFCVCDQKLFSFEWLNTQLSSFCYGELDKPEPIQKLDVLSVSKIKQTSGAMLTLCKILPVIVGRKVPDDCQQWLHFLRLVQITFLATCPVVTFDTAADLRQLIVTHHLVFMELYPKTSIAPKMHYLIHLPDQLLMFGPLRHQWCMRFEAKHAFFKSLKLKCFKNLPKSLAMKHQLWMCSQQLGPLGSATKNFLYEGDIIAEGEETPFGDQFPNLNSKFTAMISNSAEKTSSTSQPADGPVYVYMTDSAKIHGISYRKGCVLVSGCSNDDLPTFSLLQTIVVHDAVKYFVLEELQIESFETNLMCYSVSSTGSVDIVKHATLYNSWPLIMHVVDNMQLVMNVYGHISESVV